MNRTHQENLALYAKLAIAGGVGLAPGQELILRTETQNLELARLIMKEAYEVGAKYVHLVVNDEEAIKLRYQFGSNQAIGYAPKWYYESLEAAHNGNAATLAIISEDPNLLKSIPAEKVAQSSKAQGLASIGLSEIISGFRINWSLVGAPSLGWAKMVFPSETPERAIEKLWEAILYTSRVFEEDPIQAWQLHCDGLEHKKDELNKLAIRELHFTGSGTDLHVGLADGAIWQGGWGYAKNGIKCGPNIPTEEVFTMPHRSRVNGVVSSTKPLSVRGQLIDGIKMEFKDGAAIRVEAKTGQETLSKLVETDEGACRLGEVALVPHSCLVSQSNTLFYNTLYDENAASHIALGRCYSENMTDFDSYSKEEQLSRGGNNSLIHVDWMIGSGTIDVSATLADGKNIQLMKGGEWA